MPRRSIEPPALSDADVAIVARMIAFSERSYPLPTVVVGRCECGCASIDFLPDEAQESVVADAYGRTATGIDVGVHWARGGVLSGLEVCMLGTDTDQLPTPESLRINPPAIGA